MKSIAIIGIGRWGKNLVRDFSRIAKVKICVSTGKKDNLLWLKQNYPKIDHSNDLNQVLTDPKIDAIVISTPIKTHYKIAKAALIAKKNVFVEKPLTQTIKQTQELIKIAEKNKKSLFVGHVFLYNEIFSKIKDIHEKETIRYANFEWRKLGTFDEDIFENLLSHDLALILELFGYPQRIKMKNNFGLVTKVDAFSLQLFFQKCFCNVSIDRTSNLTKKTVFFKTNKYSYIWDENVLYRFEKNKNQYKAIFQTKQTPLERECKEFVNILKRDVWDINSAKLAKRISKLSLDISKKIVRF